MSKVPTLADSLQPVIDDHCIDCLTLALNIVIQETMINDNNILQRLLLKGDCRQYKEEAQQQWSWKPCRANSTRHKKFNTIQDTWISWIFQYYYILYSILFIEYFSTALLLFPLVTSHLRFKMTWMVKLNNLSTMAELGSGSPTDLKVLPKWVGEPDYGWAHLDHVV